MSKSFHTHLKLVYLNNSLADRFIWWCETFTLYWIIWTGINEEVMNLSFKLIPILSFPICAKLHVITWINYSYTNKNITQNKTKLLIYQLSSYMPSSVFIIILFGRILYNIVNLFCNNPLKHSTWIHTLAISRVQSTCFRDNWAFPLAKTIIFIFAQYKPTELGIVKLRSARTTTFGSKFF